MALATETHGAESVPAKARTRCCSLNQRQPMNFTSDWEAIKIRLDVTTPTFQFNSRMPRSGKVTPCVVMASYHSSVFCYPEDKPLHDEYTGCSSWKMCCFRFRDVSTVQLINNICLEGIDTFT